MMPTSPPPAEADISPAMTRRRQFGDGALAFGGRLLLLGTGTVTGIGLPLCLEAGDVGRFFMAQLLVAGLSLAAQIGLLPSVMALVPAELARGDKARARATILRMVSMAGTASICLAASIGAVLLAIRGQSAAGTAFGVDEGLWRLAPAILLSVPLATLTAMLAEQHRALQAFAESSFLGAGASLMSATAVLAALSGILPLTVEGLMALTVLGLAGSATLGAVRLRSRIRGWPNAPERAPRLADLWTTAWPNMITSLMLFFLSQADLWIVALFSDPTKVAHYGLAQRLSALLLLPLATMNAILIPQASRLWTQGRRQELQKLLTVSASLAAAATALGYAVLLAAGGPLVSLLWGPDYAPVSTLCVILGLGQTVHVFGGSSGVLLLALGRQRTVLRITAGSGVLTAALGIFGMVAVGPVGVASAFAFGLAVQTAAFVVTARRTLSLNPTPLPRSHPALGGAWRTLWPGRAG